MNETMRNTGERKMMKRATRVLSLIAAVALVAACESDPEKGKPGTGTTTGFPGMNGAGAGLGGVGSADITPGSKADFEVNVGDRVFFGYDQTELSPESRDILQRQAEWLKRYGSVQVLIEGHTDERGTREYNIGLGDRRAASVKNYLTALGIDARRIDTTSFGKERPAVVGGDEEAFAQNRRGVTTVR
jgi:peptidoglycan-associated lipoprotein